ncbi:MAG: hypothetical protein V4529_16870 [Gemmatimonadota bacterium]
MALKTFRRGSSTFPCNVCGRLTRETVTVGNKICAQCFELAGLENEVSDGYKTLAEARDEAVALIADVESKGGDASEWKVTFNVSAEVE